MKYKKVLLGLVLSTGIMNAENITGIRLNQITPLIKCDSNNRCGGVNAESLRISFVDPEITSIICKNEKDCDGISSIEAKMKGLNTVVICKVNQDCGNVDFKSAIHYGLKPVVSCDAYGDCSGLTPTDIRMNQMTPVVFCNSNGECK